MRHPRHAVFARVTYTSRSRRRASCGFLIALATSAGCLFMSPFVQLAQGSGNLPFSGQEASSVQSGGAIRSEVAVQTVAVQVKDKQGNDVKGLTSSDFSVREDGIPQKISFFDAGSGPVDVAVLVDSSGSMARQWHLGSAQEIAARFMRIARPGDQVWAMDFTEWTGPFEQIAAKELSNPGPVTVPPAGGSGSSVHDAIASAVCHLRDSKNTRQAIIVITDGADEHSRISLDQLIDFVRSQRAQLFVIGLPSGPQFDFQKHAEPKVTLVSGQDINNPSVVFARLAKEAAAETFIPDSEQGLQGALKAVSNLLDSEYTLAYYPPGTSRRLRTIEVKVDQRGARLQTSRFVVSNADAAHSVHFIPGTCAVSPDVYRYPYESHVTNNPGGMIYRDDFSDGASGWPQHPNSHYAPGGYEISTVVQKSEESTPSTMTPGVMRLGETTNLVASYRDNVVAANGPSWNDFRMSATMRPLLGPASNGSQIKFSTAVRASAGLVFRMNQAGYYALLLGSPPKDKNFSFELVARRFERDAFEETVIVPWTPVPGAAPAEVTLAIEAIGDQINVFVDGQQVGSARDDTYHEGYVGFTVAAPARATFSNLLVEQTSQFRPATSVAFDEPTPSPSGSGQTASTAPPISTAPPMISANLASTGNKPWMSKPYDAWDDKDIRSIMTQSPWVQTTTIERTWLPVSAVDVAPQALIDGGVRAFPKDAPNLSGASPAMTVRASESSTRGDLEVYVSWVSSRVMRAASARQRVLHGEISESDVEPYVHVALDEYALVLSMADMTPFLQNDEKFFQRQAFLQLRRHSRELSPSHVTYQKDAKGTLQQVVFFFPKETPSGERTIASDETDVEFRCKIGDSNLRVGFKPPEMKDQAGPDL